MTDKDKEKEKLKTYFILYGMLWFLGLVIAGALGYNKHVNGDATIFTAMDTVTHFGIFYWLYPSAWGTCLKWTFIYWIGIAMFLIYEQKFKHDMAGKEVVQQNGMIRLKNLTKDTTSLSGIKCFTLKAVKPKKT